MRIHWIVAVALLFAAQLGADDSAHAGFEQFVEGRPLLPWETLKGYRLFFHPDDPETMRRALILAIPTNRKVISAYSLVRPLDPDPNFSDAWLRIEGEIGNDRISFSWDGTYRGQVFPDMNYLYEVHVRWADGSFLNQSVDVVKSLDHPKLIKVASEDLLDHPLVFKGGEFRPQNVSARVSKQDGLQVPVMARVMAPLLHDEFSSEGIQLSYRHIQDEGGHPIPGRQNWYCACQQALPEDSPARLKAKKVLCSWDLTDVLPGIYELRLSLYHKMNHPGQFDACDTPILDEDRIRVLVQP
jgi:hypothetical protein